MNKYKTEIDGVYVIQPQIYGDHRGYFFESYRKEWLPEYDFIQDNQSFTKDAGTFRGIHFQKFPYAQAKLVRVVKGAVIDYIVDLRKNSPTFKKWVAIRLDEESQKQVIIPRGCGHGFLTMTDDVVFAYKCDNYYNYDADRSINYRDDEIGLTFDIPVVNISEKDNNAKYLKDIDLD